jgi:hypothetical protein
VHRPPPAAATRPCPGSLLAAPAPLPSSDLGIDPGLLFEDVSPFLEFLPLEYNGFDIQGFADATWNLGNNNNNNVQNIDGDGLFDNIMIPDLNVLDTQSSLDVAGDGFLTQEQPLLTVNSTPIEQPSTSTSSTPHPPSTTTSNKSPTSTSAIPGTSTFSLHPSPSSSSSSSSRKRKSSPEAEDSAVTLKRQRNTLAARKYRQKRLDRISELEEALAAMTKDRDDMRLQLARREAEVDALREMLPKK